MHFGPRSFKDQLCGRRIPAKLAARERTGPSFGEKTDRIQASEQIDQEADHTGPAGLMAGADSGTVVAVEIFVKQNIVPPVRVGLELFRAAIGRSVALLVAQE